MANFCAAHAQPPSDDDVWRRQTQQREAMQNRAGRTPDVMLTNAQEKTGSALHSLTLPAESPCFVIHDVIWRGAEAFTGLTSNDQWVRDQCIGTQGLRSFQDHITRQLISQGHITSRLLIPEQNLAAGRLIVQVAPGRIGTIRDVGKAPGWARMALFANSGTVLNQRDLDQALENMRRLPGQQSVEFDLVPGTKQGDTDIVIKHPNSKAWHGLLSLDDSGMDATGKYQLGGTLMIDSPLHLYDALTLTVNNNANASNDTLGTRAFAINWNVPIGYGALFLGWNQSHYKQTVAGFSDNIVYRGRSHGVEIGIDYVAYRTTHAKGALQVKLTRKVSASDIDDVEVDVQHRDITGYELGIAHRQFETAGTFEVKASVRGSLPEQSKALGVIVGVPQWDGHYRLISASINAIMPFSVSGLRYQAAWRMQHATTVLPATDYFSVGNRYSVRGFDGAATLSAENGWTLRNDLVWPIGQSAQEGFIGLDTGHVSGPNAETLAGHLLTGTVIGLRGRVDHFTYETTVGWPLSSPTVLHPSTPTLTAAISADF